MKYCLLAILFLTSPQASSQEPKFETLRYKTVQGKDLETDIYFPEGHNRKTAKAPMIIFFHGGGWTGGNRASLSRQSEYFANRGMVAATVSYRLVTKGTADYETEFRNCIYDAKSAVRWLKEHAAELGADSSRIVLGGGSAGGYLAAMAALDDQINDPADNLRISTKPLALVLFNPAFPKRKEVPLPFDQIKLNSAPVISFFGDNDEAWLPQGKVFDERLKAKGVRTEFWIAAGQKHAFYNQQEWTDATLNRADQFLTARGLLSKVPLKPVHPGLSAQ